MSSTRTRLTSDTVMESQEYIQTKLNCRTNASEVLVEAKHNRLHYNLLFTEDIGFDWLEAQINKCSAEVNATLELYEVQPCKYQFGAFEVVVRELERRKGADSSQHSLDSFEK